MLTEGQSFGCNELLLANLGAALEREQPFSLVSMATWLAAASGQ